MIDAIKSALGIGNSDAAGSQNTAPAPAPEMTDPAQLAADAKALMDATAPKAGESDEAEETPRHDAAYYAGFRE